MDIITHRRNLHRIPELERDLPETTAYILAQLKTLPCWVFVPAPGSLAAFFDFGGKHTVAFRADMDALPIREATGAPYASRHDGCMHACGHDGHTAILLDLARRLRGGPNNVLLLFQCGEEHPGGAEPICQSGVLAGYGVRAIFGLHLWPGLPKGELFSTAGPMMSSSQEVHVTVTGKSSHIAKAAEGVDALAIGMEFYEKANLLSQSIPSSVPKLLKFGTFQAGTACNAIAGQALLSGSLRSFDDDTQRELSHGLEQIARQLEREHGCKISVELSKGYPALANDKSLLEKARAMEAVGELPQYSMTSEDFSFYQRAVPGVFFFLGLGDTPPLHSANFDFDDSVLEKGALFFEKLAKVTL